MAWSNLTEWWLSELESDPAYQAVVTPLLIEMLQPKPEHTYLDAGCGEGRVMRVLSEWGALVHGLDINVELARMAERAVVADLVSIPIRGNRYDGVYSVLTLEHVEDHESFFAEAGRVTKPGGVLAIVINHPVWTAPGSTPISDSDGEVLWRPGDYFSFGSSEVAANGTLVTFRHRTMADLLNGAARPGWSLEAMIEQAHHDCEDQAGIPRLLGCRWRLRS